MTDDAFNDITDPPSICRAELNGATDCVDQVIDNIVGLVTPTVVKAKHGETMPSQFGEEVPEEKFSFGGVAEMISI
ncbi:hypothetical protein A9Y76_07900 [Ralstonia insidiosa]|uniref:Uncharacterized protein n=1 Tax=Ralstonia insidiosa TaxID=190721 RepID=A0A191ZWE0_9RALS|nr:hypothetical protein A9Y76_07900 [Ralstonia insidiosa]